MSEKLFTIHYSLFTRDAVSQSVVPGRLELPTSTLSVWRSNQLSYRTGFKLSALTKSAQLLLFSRKQMREYKKHRVIQQTLLHSYYR